MREILGWMLGLWWFGATTAYLATLILSATKARSSPAAGPMHRPPASILVPLKGIEPEFSDNLRSLFSQRYPEFELIFVFDEPDDPAIPVVRGIMAEHPAIPARIVVATDMSTGNPKVDKLAHAEQCAAHDLFLMCDGNAALAPEALARMVSALRPDIGLVSAIPLAGRPSNFIGELECAMCNGLAARWLLAADRLGFGLAQGKLMLLSRETLRRIGGIRIMARGLCEDAVLAEAIHRLDLRVIAPDTVLNPIGGRRFRDFWDRHLRWHCCHRLHHPSTYGFEPVTGALAATIAGTFFSHQIFGIPPAAAIAANLMLWLGAEALYLRRQNWHMSWRSPAAWLLREFIAPVLWVQALRTRSLLWRGARLDVADLRR